jgi:hypothetical protein
MPHRLAYRARQFWNALPGSRKRVETSRLLLYLKPVQIVLFQRMKPSEQVHAFGMLERLQDSGHHDPDLLAAALLHDVGKILSPLSLLDRVVIVLGHRLFPRCSRRWGEGRLNRLHRPFIVAAHHPDWGADLAMRAEASTIAVELIRRHQQPLPDNPDTDRDRLLAALQTADENN